MAHQRLEKILNEEYGVGSFVAPAETVLWAAAELPAETAKAELTSLNARRAKFGRPVIYAPYGHPAF